jgi:hypothetical protein
MPPDPTRASPRVETPKRALGPVLNPPLVPRRLFVRYEGTSQDLNLRSPRMAKRWPGGIGRVRGQNLMQYRAHDLSSFVVGTSVVWGLVSSLHKDANGDRRVPGAVRRRPGAWVTGTMESAPILACAGQRGRPWCGRRWSIGASLALPDELVAGVPGSVIVPVVPVPLVAPFLLLLILVV